ncbi:MAG: Arylsulfatase A or related enzyme [Methanophagales archaeon]|nr:sulfatase-like hydrolase/transferase [Methanophagales archaeon]MCU4139667.1 Arylsulfatase A or related enzyme [Methanophagales archaeon]
MRNIVLVTLDSVRADHCSFMGYHRETTPTLDKMAREGLVFENAIAAGVGTPASMMGAFTGNFAPLADEINSKLWREEFKRRKTLAQVLSKLGYSTGAVVPNTFASSYFGFNKGFQYFQDFLGGKTKFYERIFERVFRKNGKTAFFIRNLMNFVLKREVFTPWEKYYEEITDWVEKTKEPFFLWILLMDTHFPYLAPRKFRKRSSFLSMYCSNWKLQSVNFENRLIERERQKLIDAYDDSIRYADEFVKRLIKDLKDYDPIYIIHSDHGEGFGEHGFYMHGFIRNKAVCLYEELIHIPLIIYNADIMGRIKEPVSLLGLSPTILEIIDKNNEFPSKSFLRSGNEWVMVGAVENGRIKIAIRMKNWKFITGQKDVDELYNLKSDPHEQENVINEYPELAKEMRRIVEIHVKQEMEKRKIRERISRIKL